MAEDEEAEDEEMGVAETYADYWPAKCKSINSWRFSLSIKESFAFSENRQEASRSSR